MRCPVAYIPLFLLPTLSALQIPSIFAPFYEPHLEESLLLSNVSLASDNPDLRKRDGNCPDNYNSCSTLAAADAGACCTVGSFCTTDRAKNIACCPTGATCTGSITKGTATAATSGAGGVFGTGTTSVTTTSTSTAATITSAATLSTVVNSFFPWPFIPTTYVNSAACMTAYSDCQSNYAACTADLAGGNAFPVTIVAPGGGVTVAATAQSLGAASATSICSSLYNVGCYGIVPANCATFGTGTATGFIVATTTGAGARQTMGCFAKAGVVAGLGIGIAGQMI